jgi:DNA-directed RNA polymerase specialized sigma24 family protein
MRGIVIDYARSRNSLKRGGEFEMMPLVEDLFSNFTDDGHLTSISDALDQLAKIEPELAEVVELKFFCGFSFAEIGAMQRLSERTVQRKWEKARIFLYSSMGAKPLSGSACG